MYLVMFAAALKGIGGASIIQQLAQRSYVADTVSPRWRSIVFSIMVLVKKLTSLTSLVLFTPVTMLVARHPNNSMFLISFSSWILYAAAAAMLLQRDAPSLRAARSDYPTWSFFEVARSIMDPIRLTFGNQVLLLLTAIYTLVELVQNGFGLELQISRFAIRRMGETVAASVRFYSEISVHLIHLRRSPNRWSGILRS